MRRRSIRMVALALTVVFSASYALAQKEPIKIGVINVLSGAFAAYGKSGKQGTELAVDEINASGGVLGRKIVFTQVDDQGKPDVATQEARRLILNEKVNFLFGIDSSSARARSGMRVFEKFRPQLAPDPTPAGSHLRAGSASIRHDHPRLPLGSWSLSRDC